MFVSLLVLEVWCMYHYLSTGQLRGTSITLN